jgi:hypothetical protein
MLNKIGSSSERMKALDKSYIMESARFDDQRWYAVMQQFVDANLNQTPSYDRFGSALRGYSHLLVRKENEIVAAAQTRLIQLPVVKRGIAYVSQGPMWKKNGAPEDPEIFRQTIRALRNEYSRRQGLILRLYPIAFRGKDNHIEEILYDEGYRRYDDGQSNRTLIIDLSPKLQEIRADLDQKWRNCLNRAEKNGPEIVEGEEDALFDQIVKIHREMADRKGLSDFGYTEHLRKVQRDLPPGYKLRIILCCLNGEIQSGAIFSAIGNTAAYLVGATSNAGMNSKGSYTIQWTFIKWLKEKGFRYFDLNGITPEVNPGTYHFKCGLAGKKGMDVTFLGKFQVADNPLSSLVVSCGESLVSVYTKALRKVRTLKN